MQKIVARRHGIQIGITVAALVFWFAHFNHESGPVRGFLLFGGGLLMGYLAYQARSIVPLVIAHTASDIYTGLMSRNIIDSSYVLVPKLVRDTGLDAHFITWSVVTIVCVGVVIIAGAKLQALR